MSLLQFVRHCFDLEKDVLHVSIIQKTMEIAITVQKNSDKWVSLRYNCGTYIDGKKVLMIKKL